MTNIFEIVRDGDCLLVIPAMDLGETVFEQNREQTAALVEALDEPSVRNLVMDFHKTQQFGSTALGFFVKLWKRVRNRNGRMAFCNLSPHEKGDPPPNETR